MDQNKVDMYVMTNQKYFPAEKIMYLKEKLAAMDENKFTMVSTVELKDPTTILLVSIFLGGLGIDRFMLGDTGEAWREVANSRDAGLLEVELFCSDQAEHHRRAESRGATVPGLKLPSWEAIRNREYEPWGDANLRFDTCVASPEEVAEQIRKSVDNLAGGPSESPRGNTPRRQSGGRPQSC